MRQPTTALVKRSLPSVTGRRRATGRRRMAEHLVALRGQPADEPFRLDRVPSPGLGPAVRDAGRDGFFGNLAAVAIEQWEFSTGLIETALEISPLWRGWPHACLIGVFIMTGGELGNLSQVGVSARGFPISRVGAHGRYLLTMIKTSLPRRFIWARQME